MVAERPVENTDNKPALARSARSADTALVFYAGHGMQHNGINYLIPTDGELRDEADLRRFIKVRDIIQDLNNSKGAKILILDACRDNTALTQLAANLPKSRSTAFSRGLANEKAEGVLIAFAAQPGAVAEDGTGQRNSPFTAALLKYIKTPDEDIRVMLTKVRMDVLAATRQQQRPETSDSMTGLFEFN